MDPRLFVEEGSSTTNRCLVGDLNWGLMERNNPVQESDVLHDEQNMHWEL